MNSTWAADEFQVWLLRRIASKEQERQSYRNDPERRHSSSVSLLETEIAEVRLVQAEFAQRFGLAKAP